MRRMTTIDVVFLVGLAAVAAVQVFVLWRYPDYRRAVVRYWSGPEVARRMSEWAERKRGA